MCKSSVYVLLCKNGRYYVGSTNNLERRLLEHKSGKNKATKYLLPVVLVFHQEFDNLSQARKAESYIKKQKSRKLIDQIILDGLIKSQQID